MVTGQAKSQLEGMNVVVSLPGVSIKEANKTIASTPGPILVLPCDSELGRFTVEVAMKVVRRAQTTQPAKVGAN